MRGLRREKPVWRECRDLLRRMEIPRLARDDMPPAVIPSEARNLFNSRTDGGEPMNRGMKRWLGICAVTAALLVHVALVLRHFPLGSLLSGTPLCSGDLSFHFDSCFEGAQMLRAGGGLWAYSPNFMAGYPFGTWLSFGRRAYELAPALLPMCSVTTVFYVVLVVSALLPPVLIALAAVVLGWKRGGVALCFCIGVLIYQLDNSVSYFWTYGNLSFPLVNSLCVLYVALLCRGIEERRMLHACLAGLLLGLIGWMHQLVVFPAAVASLAAVALRGRALFRRRTLLYPLATAVIAFLVVLPWLLVLVRFAGERRTMPVDALASGIKYFVMDFFSDRAYRHPYDRRALFHVEVVLAGIGAVAAIRRKQFGVLVPALTAGAALFAAYFFEYSFFLKQMQQYRFVVTFSLLAAIPAALGLTELSAWLRETNRAGRLAAVCVGLMLLPSLTGYVFDLQQRSPAEGLTNDERRVVEWLLENADHRGRVLCQPAQLGNMLPYYTGRETVGGAISTCANIPHGVVTVSDMVLMDKSLRDVSPADIAAYAEQYNLAYAIAGTSDLRNKLRRLDEAELSFQSGPFLVFTLRGRPLTFVQGPDQGRDTTVRASMNRILVENASAGRFTLKYHYMEALRPPEGVELFPVEVPHDPVPFLGVDNRAGLEIVEIVNGGLWSRRE